VLGASTWQQSGNGLRRDRVPRWAGFGTCATATYDLDADGVSRTHRRGNAYCRLTISLIQIGAKGEVQPFDSG
jgi:hypothetical protein